MKDVIYEMSSKGFGIAGVIGEDQRLMGVISDGDLRRLLQADDRMIQRTAQECMKPGPITIDRDELASAGLQQMEERKITALFVTDDSGRAEGLLHIHDLWGLELF